MDKRITCLIPAHNEEKRIGNVLNVISKHPLINEVIVIDDGSTDSTSKVARRFKKIKLITYKKNKGKCSAILSGIKKAKGDYLVLIDSDLIGLNNKNLSDLINPVITARADVSIGLTSKHKVGVNLLDLAVLLSGQRAFKKDIIDYNQFRNLPGYGFEALFNLRIVQNRLKVKLLPWPNVRNTAKIGKIGLLKGLMHEFRMGWHVLKSVGVFGCTNQMLFLRSLAVN